MTDYTEENYLWGAHLDAADADEGEEMIEPNLEKQAREYFLKGGGGFEDGEAGAKSCTFSFDGMVEMAAAFGEYMVEKSATIAGRCEHWYEGRGDAVGRYAANEIRALIK